MIPTSPASFRWQIGRSLSFRIFLICFVFWIIPLFFYSLWMYRSEYKSQKQNLLLSLQVFAKDRTFFIQNILDKERILLQQYAQELILPTSSSEVTSFLEKRATTLASSSLFLLSKQGEKLHCIQASIPSWVGKTFPDIEVKEEENGFFLPVWEEGLLLLAYPLSQNQYLATLFPVEDFLNHLGIKNFSFPLYFTLLSPQDRAFFSTEASFQGKSFSLKPSFSSIYLKKIEKTSDAFIGKQGDSFLAISTPMGKKGWKLLITAYEKPLQKLSFYTQLQRVSFLLLWACILGGLLTYLLIVRFTRPFKALFQVMQRLSKGERKARFLSDKLGFEINLLGAYFNDMMEALQKTQKEAQEQLLQRTLLEQQMQLAQEMQRSLLPKELNFPFLEIGKEFIPSLHIGGDFYDIFSLTEEKVLFYIADISGKGMEAGLYAFALRSYLRACVKELSDISLLLQTTNDLFWQDAKEKSIFATLWMGCYEKSSQLLTYASLGHPPAYLLREDTIFELVTSKNIPLGIQPTSFTVKSIQIEEGDLLFFFTDGFFEAQDEKGAFYSLERLKGEIQKQAKQGSPQKIIGALLAEMDAFQKKPADDRAIVAIRFKKERAKGSFF